MPFVINEWNKRKFRKEILFIFPFFLISFVFVFSFQNSFEFLSQKLLFVNKCFWFFVLNFSGKFCFMSFQFFSLIRNREFILLLLDCFQKLFCYYLQTFEFNFTKILSDTTELNTSIQRVKMAQNVDTVRQLINK